MITAAQVLCHVVGDYLIQSHWMATNKTKRWFPAAIHALTYTAVFLFLTTNPITLLVIGGSHYLIDRYRLARYVVWWKNYLSPVSEWPRVVIDSLGKVYYEQPRIEQTVWAERKLAVMHPTNTGYSDDVPPWLAVWLLIIADNALHVIINGLALYYIG